MAEAEKAMAQKSMFIIGPIGPAGSEIRNDANWLMQEIVERALSESGKEYSVVRADTDPHPGEITTRFLTLIEEADVVVADLTGLNANVFYELGFADTLRKPVIVFAKEGTKLPFDKSVTRAIFFGTESPGALEVARKEFLRHLDRLEEPGFEPTNPITMARGMKDIARSGDSRDQIIQKLTGIIEIQDRRLDALEKTADHNQALRSIKFRDYHDVISSPNPSIRFGRGRMTDEEFDEENRLRSLIYKLEKDGNEEDAPNFAVLDPEDNADRRSRAAAIRAQRLRRPEEK